MRVAIAAACAMLFALLGVLVVARPGSSYFVARHLFESPDAAATAPLLLFLGSGLTGLVIGWTAGWWLAGRWLRRS